MCVRPRSCGHTVKLLPLRKSKSEDRRESGPGVTEGSLLMLLTMITGEKTQVLSRCLGKTSYACV